MSTTTMRPCKKNDECLHPECQTCGRLVRSGHQPGKDHPGTLSGRLKSTACNSCLTKYDLPPPQNLPGRCVGCETPLRVRSESITDYPGTKVHHAHGRCKRCYNRAREPQEAATKPQTAIPLVSEPQGQLEANNVRGLQRFLQARYEREIRRRRAILLEASMTR